MMITVAICTWNRASLLEQTLTQMHHLRVPEDVKWELLVVNNSCSDDTDVIIAQHADMLPIRRIFERKTGLSNARNAAVQHAKGDYIIWTDDDVLVDGSWLDAYVQAFKKYPESVVFGGPIFPWFQGTPPAWLSENWDLVASAFAACDHGAQELPLDSYNNVLPYGANFTVRMQEQSTILYDPRLGLKGDTRILGEETAVIKNILTSGKTGRWVPNATVKHYIPATRQTLKYLSKYYIGQGMTSYLLDGIRDDSVYLLGKPRWLIRKVIETQVYYWFRRILFGTSASIQARIDASIYIGMFSKY